MWREGSIKRFICVGATAIFVLMIGAEPAQAAWSVKVIAHDDAPSPTSSLVIGPGGVAYDAWQSRGSTDLHWATLSAAGWKSTTVFHRTSTDSCYSSEYDGIGPSAAFLPSGEPEIASVCIYFSGLSNILYTQHTAKGWKTKTVGYLPSGPCDMSATDLQLINNPTTGRPVIVLVNQCSRELTGYYSTGHGWARKVMMAGSNGPFHHRAVSLAVDPTTGDLAVAWAITDGRVEEVDGFHSFFFFDLFNWDLTPVSGQFKILTLPNGDVPRGTPSLGFLPNGTGYLALEEGTPVGTAPAGAYGFLVLMTWTSGTWSAPVTVDNTAPITGGDPSLSLVGGTFHIAYQNVTNGDLRYATSSNASTWTLKTLSAPHNTGFFPSLGVTVGGLVRIADFDRTTNNLVETGGP